MKVVSKNGKTYYPIDPEVQRQKMVKYYDNNKERIIRKKILSYSLEVLGRVPTLSSIEKYGISPGELVQHFKGFKENCQDTEIIKKTQEKLLLRIQNGWT